MTELEQLEFNTGGSALPDIAGSLNHHFRSFTGKTDNHVHDYIDADLREILYGFVIV